MALTEERRRGLEEIFGKQQPTAPAQDTQTRIERLRAIAEEAKAPKEEPVFTERPTPLAPVRETEEQGLGEKVLRGVGGFYKDVFEAGAKGLGQTVSGSASLGQKMLEGTVGKALGVEPAEETVGQRVARSEALQPEGAVQKGAFAGEQLMEFFAPGGATTKLVTKPKLLTRSLLGAAELGGVSALQEGEIGKEAIESATIGGVFPVGGKVISKIAEKIPFSKVGSILTNVPKDVLSRIYKNPYKIDLAIEQISQNQKQPFLIMGERLAESISGLRKLAAKEWENSANNFREEFGDATFNFADKIPQLRTSLNKFGLTLKQGMKDGKLTSEFTVVPKGKITDFTKKEIRNIQSLVDDLRNADGFTIDDIFAFRGKFDTLYNDIPFTLDKNPKKYHALITGMKEYADDFISAVLPKEMKNADKLYKDYYDMYKAFGNKITDASGRLKPSAEQFLSNINNMNRGEIRKQIAKYKNRLGIDIVDDVQAIKDAKKISELFATTGSRTQDIIRSLLVTGTGFGTGGPVGGILAAGATSPKGIGELTKRLGKFKSKIPEDISSDLAKIFAGIRGRD